MQPPPIRTKRSAMSSLQDKEILIIDDADDIRLLARKILENDGALIHEANDIPTGLGLAQEKQPHLILLDLQFQGANGFDFLAARVSDPALKKIPVIIFSTKSDKESVMKAVSLSANDYLLKPFRATQLLQKVRKILRVASFQRIMFPEGTEPDVNVTVPGQIVQLSECGLKLESATKFERDLTVEVKADILDSLQVSEATLKISSRAAFYEGPGRYSNSILFSGVGEAFTKRLKKALGG